MRKKRLLTLLELMIAIGLGLAILSSALFFYRFAIVQNEEIYRKEKEAFRLRVVQFKLNELFQRVDAKSLFFTKPESHLTRGTSLVLKVINPPFDIPTFSGPALQTLLVDSEKRLVIATWQFNDSLGDETMPDMHLEILLENVDRIDFQFLVKETDLSNAELRGGSWIKEWKPDYGQVPAAVKILVDNKEFAFPVATQKEDG